MGKSSKPSSSTTQSAQPWSGAQPYLLGGDATAPGVFPNAAAQFNQGGWSPEQQAQAGQWNQFLQQQQGNAQNQSNYGNALMAGANNANITPVAGVANNTSAAPERVGGWGEIQAQAVDPTQALASLGAVNPTQALQNQLSGSVSNPYLDQQIAGIGTDISNNLNRNVLPGLRGEAVASGQYGSSRQGIAEGLAAQGATQQLTNAASSLRGNAYESAQNRQGTAAGNLANLGIGNATNNANRDLSAQTSNAANTLQAQMFNSSQGTQNNQFNASQGNNTNQFNANLGLQNNNQAIQNSANNTNNSLAGSNILNQGLNYGNNAYGQGLSNLGMGQQQNWQNLNNYANIINSGAGLGSTQTSSGGGGSNPIAGILGGGLAGAQLGPLAGLSGPWGAAAGAGLGLLGGLF